MKMNNLLAKKMFALDKREIANFIALFTSMEINDEFSSSLGKIKKTSENDFKISVTVKNYENILEELVTSENEIYNIFQTK